MDGGTQSVADETRSVLLALRLRAFGEVAAVEDELRSLGLPVGDVGTLVGRLELAGLVEHRDGAAPGWRLTDDGREEGERLLRVELDALDARTAVQHAYERFLGLNGPLLHVCTDWQLRGGAGTPDAVANDHTDPAYDEAVLDRWREIHRRTVPICGDLAAALARFTGYEPRFADAARRVAAGDHHALDQAGTDSFHTIWFELHDHLIATLGIDRATEPLPSPQLPPA